jgi:hypothetical protein
VSVLALEGAVRVQCAGQRLGAVLESVQRAGLGLGAVVENKWRTCTGVRAGGGDVCLQRNSPAWAQSVLCIVAIHYSY